MRSLNYAASHLMEDGQWSWDSPSLSERVTGCRVAERRAGAPVPAAAETLEGDVEFAIEPRLPRPPKSSRRRRRENVGDDRARRRSKPVAPADHFFEKTFPRAPRSGGRLLTRCREGLRRRRAFGGGAQPGSRSGLIISGFYASTFFLCGEDGAARHGRCSEAVVGVRVRVARRRNGRSAAWKQLLHTHVLHAGVRLYRRKL